MTGNWKVGRGRDWRPHVPCRGMFSGKPGTSLEEKKLNIEFYLANLGECGGGGGGGGGGVGVGVLGSVFAGHVPLASQNPYPIIVYFWSIL